MATPLLTCLIVDDSPEFLAAAKELLAHDGVTIVGLATTSGEALDEIVDLSPDVVLVDVDLGVESGFELARQIARLPDGGPPVILISADSGADLGELVEASGVLGFVSKADLSGNAIRVLLARSRD